MPNIGPLELAIVLVKRLPDLGRSLGSGMREFKDSITGKNDDDEDRAELEVAASQPQPDPDAEPVKGEVVEDRS